jgi:hypothetical protein
MNDGIEYAMGLGGYNVDRRGVQGNGNALGTAAGDNSFYRDNASFMPGWGNTFGLGFLDPHGVPSGATTHDRATNHIGVNVPMNPLETMVWDGVREDLVTNESAAIAARQAAGETNITFWDAYQAHVDAYDSAQADGRAFDPNSDAATPFIDPASFALAVYGAPLMEHFGINAGPITGASIDLTNDPTDAVGDSWAKRMVLAAGEVGTGAAALGLGATAMCAGNVPMGLAAGAAGVGLMGLGAFTGVYNTAEAMGNGMGVGDAVSGVGNVGSAMLGAGGQLASDAWSCVF